MLRELAVKNLALIEDVRVELAPGFCAWTGETGAGKSLLLGAIGLLLGERGGPDLIRSGVEECRVTGRFDLPRAEQRIAIEELLQTELADDDLVLTRRLARSGRSSALVNELPVSVATLKKLGELLVDVHGQRESHSLLQPGYQLDLLDAFGRLGELRRAYQTAAHGVRGLRSRRRDLTDARAARQRELALVRFERAELDAAKLKSGERDQLERERETLVHAQALAALSGSVATRLVDDDGAVAVILSRLLKDSSRWAHVHPALGDVHRRLAALKPEVVDLAETCRELVDRFEPNPARLMAIEKRLDVLDRLQAKYRRGVDELAAYHELLPALEKKLQGEEDDLDAITETLGAAQADLELAAGRLSEARRPVAAKLAEQAERHLADLGMPAARLSAALETAPCLDIGGEGELPASGLDQLELMLAANPGEPPRPLRKIASGGELSRTLLALKTVLAAHDPVRTLVVFDEIDANVGGRLGDVLGQKLASLGRTHQVLCITHLPQVASYAEHHWAIRKSTHGERTATTITPLTKSAERVEELAVMLRGGARSETTRKEAAQMLKNAGKRAKLPPAALRPGG